MRRAASTGTALLPPTTRQGAGASIAAAPTPTTAPSAVQEGKIVHACRGPGTPMATSPPTGSATRYGTQLARQRVCYDVRVHDLRHAHASWLLAGGADLQVVKERLGHASIMTTQRYLHTLPDADETAVEAFSRIRNRAQGRSA